MAEITAAAVSALAAILIAILAHKRSMKAQKAEQKADRDAQSNDKIRLITDSYESLVGQLRLDRDNINETRNLEYERFRKRENDLLESINKLQAELNAEREARMNLQVRVAHLESKIDLLSKE